MINPIVKKSVYVAPVIAVGVLTNTILQSKKQTPKVLSQCINPDKVFDIMKKNPSTLTNKTAVENNNKPTDTEIDDNYDWYYAKYEVRKNFDDKGNPISKDTLFDNIDDDDIFCMEITTADKKDIEKIKSNLKNNELKNIFSIITDKELATYDVLNYVQELDTYCNEIKDEPFKNYIKQSMIKTLKNLKKDDKIEIIDPDIDIIPSLKKILNIIDAYNNLNENYATIKSYDPSGDELKDSDYFSFYKNHKDILSGLIDNSNSTKYFFASEFLNAQKSEQYIKCLLEDEGHDKFLNKTMYEEYYLKNINCLQEIKDLCKEINDNYNIKVFLSAKSDIFTLTKIKNELAEWYKYKTKNTVLPKIIDLNNVDENFLGSSDGYNREKTYIKIRNCNPEDFAEILRHELIHSANNNTIDPSIHTREYYTEKIKRSSGIAPASVLKNYQVQLAKLDLFTEIAPKKIIKNPKGGYSEVVDFEKCKYRDELFNAGIPKRLIRYAYCNIEEFLSVLATGDMTKYSPELKADLIKLGMPRFVFKMEPVVDNIMLIASEKVREKYPNETDFNKLIELRKKEYKIAEKIFNKNIESFLNSFFST